MNENQGKHRQKLIILTAVLTILSTYFWSAIRSSAAQVIEQAPEKIAEEFISALAAHHYNGARDRLSENLRSTTSDERLSLLVAHIEARTAGILDARSETTLQNGDQALATLRLSMRDGSETMVDLPLARENGRWKITGLDDLWSLLFTRPPFRLLMS